MNETAKTKPDTAVAPVLTIERVFDAPRELVFRLWVEPHHLERWFRPAGCRVIDVGTDFRPGGAWFSHIRSAGGKDYRMGGVYREIVEPSRIVFTHAWVDEQGNPGLETLVTITLEALGEQTRLSFHQAIFDSAESRDSHRAGWAECLDRLDAYLRQLA